jgi:hypothetical protein
MHTKTIIDINSPQDLMQFVADHGTMLMGSNPPPRRLEPAPMMTRIPPGLIQVLAARPL